MIKRILGLDDDNHRPCFVCDDCKTEYNDSGDLVAFLAKPHDFKAQVKMFRLIDYPTGKLENYTDDEINDMFSFLEGYGNPPCGLTGEEIFEMFWASADENW